MGDAGELDHAGPAFTGMGGGQQGQKAADQGEVGQVVGPELHLEPIRRRLSRRQGHDPRVVDQDVDGAAIGQMPLGEGLNRRQGGQVQQIEPNTSVRMARADQPFGLGAFLRIARGQHDLGALAGQYKRRLKPQPAGRAGDDGPFAGEVGDGVRGPGHCVELKVARLKAGRLGDPREHTGSDVVVVVKSESHVSPTLA